MSNDHKAIEDFKDICFKCLEKKITTKYSLYRSNYGSSFDNNYTYMQICDECKPKDIKKWFDEEPELIDGWCEDYKYEDNIIEFVETFPVEGQELFWNRCAYGALVYNMKSQDWIDMQLGVLPDETYEDYGMYSPRQKKAYEERFPVCKNTYIREHKDGSKGSTCRLHDCTWGDEFGNIGLNPSTECYQCKDFVKREDNEQIQTIKMSF